MVELLLVARGVMVAAGVALLGMAAWTKRRGDAPALGPLVVLVATVGAFAVLDGLAAGNLTTLSIVWVTAHVAIPCVFAWFVVEYYGLPHLASRWRKVAFFLPAVGGAAGGTALILAPKEVASGSMAGGASAPAVPSPLGVAMFAEQVGIYYSGGAMLLGVGLLARTVARYDHLDGRLAAALSSVAVWPWGAYFVTPAVAGSLSVEVIVGYTASGYVLSVLALAFATTRGGLFDAAPAAGTLGPETVLSELDDPVVVVDPEHRVVRTNAAARETFGLDGATGEPFEECVGVGVDALRDPEPVELAVPGGTRQFEASISPVTDRFDRQPGLAVVIRDVTRERIRSQRLTVLNRVLRHNLRNEMTQIIGRAEIIASADTEHGTTAETIIDSADDLVQLSERAREAERLMSRTPQVEEDVAVAEVAEAVIDQYRDEFPEASLSVDVDESMTLAVDDNILSSVLDNLVENALVHNDAPTRVVTVSARETDDGEYVTVSVSDNGPGIPEQERTVIESGTESQLSHGSGLGLWAVKWGVIRLGGDLEFHDNEPQGSVVSVRLSNVTDPEETVLAPAEAD